MSESYSSSIRYQQLMSSMGDGQEVTTEDPISSNEEPLRRKILGLVSCVTAPCFKQKAEDNPGFSPQQIDRLARETNYRLAVDELYEPQLTSNTIQSAMRLENIAAWVRGRSSIRRSIESLMLQRYAKVQD